MTTLVTGAGGFLGGAIARRLVEGGEAVRSFSRGEYPDLDALGVTQVRGDLASAEAVAEAAEGCDAIFHVAAKAGSWGPYEEFHQANVVGTENVIAACRAHAIPNLIYTSSPSVVFDGRDMEGVDESVPYPAHYEAHYPATKAQAERLALSANSADLKCAALRPHLIWGPRDTNILPRLVERSRSGQLRKLGGPEKLVDVTYIDDAADAHLLAMEALRSGGDTAARVAGKAYFISSGTPIPIWQMIDRMLVAAGEPEISRSVSPRAAMAAGWVFEKLHTLLGREGEPRMTRWVAQEMSTAHWFDISAAKNDFGFAPAVGVDEGLKCLRAWHREQPRGDRG